MHLYTCSSCVQTEGPYVRCRAKDLRGQATMGMPMTLSQAPVTALAACLDSYMCIFPPLLTGD